MENVVKQECPICLDQIKEEDLNIIYQVYKSGNQDDDKILLFGFRGDIAYLWNHSE
jgi:hypothetical protein